jgi:hypothetical protein
MIAAALLIAIGIAIANDKSVKAISAALNTQAVTRAALMDPL